MLEIHIENYYALLACIFNDKLSPDRAVKAMTEVKKEKVKKRSKGVIISNIKTGEVIEFDRTKDAAEYMGVESGFISSYAIKNYKYKGTWTFKYKN